MAKTISVAFLSLILFSVQARADGLFLKLPKDGAWAEYRVTIGTKGGEHVGSLRVSSVGQTSREGEVCRWIEFRLSLPQNDKIVTDIVKILVPEKELVEGGHPFTHMRSIWHQVNDQPACRIDTLRKPRVELVGLLLSEPIPGRVEIEGKSLICNQQLFDCKGQRRRNERSQGPVEISMNYDSWSHPGTPFGVAAIRVRATASRDAEIVADAGAELSITRFGDGATSQLAKAQ